MTQRYDLLDLLRFFSAAAVVLFHYGATIYGYGHGSPVPLDVIGHAALYGRFGVQIFFVISGFVIAMSMEGRTWQQFAWARFLRLAPAYWVCVTLTALVILASGQPITWLDYAANMAMLHRALGIDYLDGVYWSLLVEIQFYAFVVAILALRMERLFLPALLAWLTLSTVRDFMPSIVNKGLALEWAPFFVAGALLHAVAHAENRRLLLLPLIAAVALCMEATWRFTVDIAMPEHEAYSPLVACLVVLAGLGAIAACVFGPQWRIPYAAAIGGVTFPLYLLHSKAGRAIIDAVDLPTAVTVLPVTILMVAASLWISQGPETAIRERLKSGRQRLIAT